MRASPEARSFAPGGRCGNENPGGRAGSASPAWRAAKKVAANAPDGVGAGASIASCTDGALPPGQVTTSGDCAPADASRWRMLTAAGADEDGDGYSTRASASVCSGTAPPAPYVATATGNDCDDGDRSLWRWVVLYPDRDGDGVGAPPRVIPCLGAAMPAGYSVYGWDPDDGDGAVGAGDGDDPLAF